MVVGSARAARTALRAMSCMSMPRSAAAVFSALCSNADSNTPYFFMQSTIFRRVSESCCTKVQLPLRSSCEQRNNANNANHAIKSYRLGGSVD